LDCATISARPFSSTDYTVRVTDNETGCTAEDAITIAVLQSRKLFVPNAFSPNGDGKNEFERQKLSTDVFIYFAEVEFIDGVREVFSGDFTLIR